MMGSSDPNVYGMIVQVIFILLVIIGLFFMLVKLVAKKNQYVQSGRSIKTLGGVSLGPNKSVQIVEIGRKLYVLGVGDNIQLLGEIVDSEEIEYIREHMIPQTKLRLDQWFAFLKPFSFRRGGPAYEIEEETELADASFQQVFHEKLRHLSSRKKNMEQLMQDEDDPERLNRP